MHTDKAIAEFEAWYIRHSAEAGITVTPEDMAKLRGKNCEYEAYPALNGKWIGWRAARTELVIELTGITILEHNGRDFYEKVGLCQAIEAAGVPVRG